MSDMNRVEFYRNDVLQHTEPGPGPEYSWSLIYWPYPSDYFSAKAYDNAGNSNWDGIYKNALMESSLLYPDIEKESTIKCFFNDVSSSDIVEKEKDRGNENSSFSNPGGNIFDPAYAIVVFNRKKIKENGWLVDNVSIPIYFESDRVDEVYYKINAGEWIQYFEPLVFSDGIYVFSWYIVDSEGYTSAPESIYFQIDRTCPEIILTKERLGIGKFKFSANVYDETSGIDRVKFKSGHGGSFTDYDFPYEWIWSPNDLVGWLNDWVTATVYDKAGNGNSCSMNIRSSSNSYKQQSSRQSTNQFIMRLFERFPMLEVFLRILNL